MTESGAGRGTEPGTAGLDHAHRLGRVLADAVAGRFPPVDGVVELCGPDANGTAAVVSFCGHAVVLSARADAAQVLDGVDAYGGVTSPSVVLALAGSDRCGSLDLVVARRAGTSGVAVAPLPARTDADDHPRVRRARRYRRDVRVLGDERGVVTIGRGLVGRTEVSVEVDHPGAGSGASLVAAALATLPHEEWVFAQVAPGNVASVRLFLGLGFIPIASEILH